MYHLYEVPTESPFAPSISCLLYIQNSTFCALYVYDGTVFLVEANIVHCKIKTRDIKLLCLVTKDKLPGSKVGQMICHKISVAVHRD